MTNPIDRVQNNQLYYQRDLRVPMTFLTIVFHGAGFQQETEELAGLARVTAKTLFRGIPSMTREEIATTLDLWGAIVEANISETDFYVSISTFSENIHAVLGLVGRIFREAHFPEQELEIVKKQEQNLLDASLQDPDHVLSSASEFALFGKNWIGKIGSRAAIRRISREDVVRFMSQVRGTGVVYTTAITDLPRETIEKELRVLLGDRDTSGFALKSEIPYTGSKGHEALIIESADSTNDRLLWSHRGIGATDERRFALSMVVDALGSFEGFLFDELRNKNGWCYGAYAYLMPATTRSGRVAYYSDPTSETSAKLIPALFHHLGTFSSEPNFLGRFRDRNTTFKNRYAYQLDLKKKLSNEVHRDRFGIPILNREEHDRKIDAVTVESALRVIADVFDHNNMTLVFYGDAKRIAKILSGLPSPVGISVLDKEALVA